MWQWFLNLFKKKEDTIPADFWEPKTLEPQASFPKEHIGQCCRPEREVCKAKNTPLDNDSGGFNSYY